MDNERHQTINEENSEGGSSEHSDPDSESESSGSSVDFGEEETEQSIYDKIQAAQEGRETGDEERKKEEKPLEELIDRNMINLLRACTMLQRPSAEDIEQRKVFLGEATRQKLLILDMDETLLHSRFHKLTGNEGQFDAGISADENGVLQFNILISQKPGIPPSLRLNVKLR